MSNNNINKSGFNNWVVDNLKSDPELAKEYLAEVMKKFDEDEDIEALLSSLKKAAKAKGWTYLEQETGISRQALYKALSEKGNPRIKTFLNIINSLGYHLRIN
ncbi:MAG: putative addiction module antidote protein [Rickettsiales bacterium]|jgi:probable addiction module antidote protein